MADVVKLDEVNFPSHCIILRNIYIMAINVLTIIAIPKIVGALGYKRMVYNS